jgi:acetylornithine deacetylase/succinyl-diaminopimelate desuccinylase-like protein
MSASLAEYLDKNDARSLEELKDLIRIPSVSADSKFKGDVKRACDFVADKLKSAGLAVDVSTVNDSHPIIYAEWLKAPGAPTVLIYGHYDVQPPDPLELWESGPFDPVEKNGDLIARGSTDDKGQMYTHVKAIEALLKVNGKLPVNVKMLIEGEEEVGSKNLGEYLDKNAKRLTCDVAIISDTSMYDYDMPAVTYGLKGLAYFELFVQGPIRDLHSGSFGGAVQNPLNALCTVIAAMKDADGRIQLPGFYDDVKPLTQQERDEFASLGFDEKRFQKELEVPALFGEKGYTTLERKWARPTCDVNGIGGGYQGEGAKTVLPAKAFAKFSFRLVPNQDPKKITASLKTFLEHHMPPGVTYELKDHHGAPGVVVPLDSPYMAAAATALEAVYGKKPYFIREGGSIPVVTDFKVRLGVDTLLMGYGLPDDRPHSPNEKFRIKDFFRGIRTNCRLLEEIAKIKK